MPRDVLEEILSAALREKAIAAESITDFAAGLRDRARLILEERLRPVQERVATLEKENAWRASAIESLTDENARVREEHARLQDERERLQDESRRLQDERRRLKEELEGVRAEWRTASDTHDRLLVHHRSVLRGAAASLLEIGALPPWKRGRARARLADLAAALGRDTA